VDNETASVFLEAAENARFAAGKQTAYQSKLHPLANSFGSGKADIWDSGKSAVGKFNSSRIRWQGIDAKQRYYWRLTVWDADGKAYPSSDGSLVRERDLMDLKNWKAAWIGYEVPELHAVRDADAAWITNADESSAKTEGNSHHDFRFAFELNSAVKHAELFVTGRDSAFLVGERPQEYWNRILCRRGSRCRGRRTRNATSLSN